MKDYTPQQQEAIKQNSLPGMKQRKFPDRPIENRFDWKRTPLFESLEKRPQMDLFKKGEEPK